MPCQGRVLSTFPILKQWNNNPSVSKRYCEEVWKCHVVRERFDAFSARFQQPQSISIKMAACRQYPVEYPNPKTQQLFYFLFVKRKWYLRSDDE